MRFRGTARLFHFQKDRSATWVLYIQHYSLFWNVCFDRLTHKPSAGGHPWSQQWGDQRCWQQHSQTAACTAHCTDSSSRLLPFSLRAHTHKHTHGAAAGIKSALRGKPKRFKRHVMLSRINSHRFVWSVRRCRHLFADHCFPNPDKTGSIRFSHWFLGLRGLKHDRSALQGL